jgi:hypothetical protein
LIPKSWRVKIFNWLGAGKITLTTDNPKDYSVSTYTLGGGGAGQPWSGGITLGPPTQGPITSQTITLKITPATGGHIVSVDDALYIIADDADFDRELGKIITVSKLKS